MKTQLNHLVSSYMSANKLSLISGDVNPNLILPFLAMDAMQVIKSEVEESFEFKGQSKKYYSLWSKGYAEFNKAFFRGLNDEDTETVIGIMDDYYSYLEKDMTVFVFSVAKALEDCPSTLIKITAAKILLCNSLAQISQIVYKCTHMSRSRVNGVVKEDRNEYIAQVEKWTWALLIEMLKPYTKKDRAKLDLMQFSSIRDSVVVLTDKAVEFFKTY